MEFKYSICYPDKDEIDFFDLPIDKSEVLRLVKEFDWDNELPKEILFYAPGLDFIKIIDRQRIIFSGIGEGKLESFQVMYILPNTKNHRNVFDESNYKNTDSFTSEVSIAKGYELLQHFVAGEYQELTNVLKKDLTYADALGVNPNLKIQLNQERHLEFSKEKNRQNTHKRLFTRVAGPLASFMFFVLALGFYVISNNISEGVYIFGGISIIFIIGSILFEIKLNKN